MRTEKDFSVFKLRKIMFLTPSLSVCHQPSPLSRGDSGRVTQVSLKTCKGKAKVRSNLGSRNLWGKQQTRFPEQDGGSLRQAALAVGSAACPACPASPVRMLFLDEAVRDSSTLSVHCHPGSSAQVSLWRPKSKSSPFSLKMCKVKAKIKLPTALTSW